LHIQRLAEVEKDFSARFDNSDYKSGDRESRLLLNAALAKVGMLINAKRDVETYVSHMEHLAKTLSKNPNESDPHYLALSKRFRLDYEEWTALAQQGPDRKLIRLCNEILPISKEYVKFAEMTKDSTLKRDALKRLMNTYIEISNVPANSLEDVLPIPGSLEKLESLFSVSEIELKERTEPDWIRQYGRARARQVFAQYKQYSV